MEVKALDLREIILLLYDEHPTISTIGVYRTLLEEGYNFSWEDVKATVKELREEGILTT